MNITWFGHSAFRVETGNAVIMVDPFLTGNPMYDGAAEDASAGATHVVLTHGHDDHVGDTVQICKDNDATLIAVFELAMYLAGQGVEKVEPTNTGGTLGQDDFDVTFVDAKHSSGTVTADGVPVYLGNPCGIIIKPKNGDQSVYHMGDTDIFGDMALIGELHAPQIGLVPIGDRFTMDARAAALACQRYFKFETVIPCHYGTFPILDQTADGFVSQMKDTKVLIPEIGKATTL